MYVCIISAVCNRFYTQSSNFQVLYVHICTQCKRTMQNVQWLYYIRTSTSPTPFLWEFNRTTIPSSNYVQLVSILICAIFKVELHFRDLVSCMNITDFYSIYQFSIFKKSRAFFLRTLLHLYKKVTIFFIIHTFRNQYSTSNYYILFKCCFKHIGWYHGLPPEPLPTTSRA